MIITIRKIALSPQPHIVQRLGTTESSDPLRTLVFSHGSLYHCIFVMISLDVSKLEINNSSFTPSMNKLAS
jgi:hypothetical protein